jgi:hypothetical protein
MIKEPVTKSDLNKILLSLLKSFKYVEIWWQSENEAFDNKTPNDLYWSGGESRQKVIDYVLGQVNSDYSR